MNYALDIKVLASLEPMAAFGTDAFRQHGLAGQSVYLVWGEIELIYQGPE